MICEKRKLIQINFFCKILFESKKTNIFIINIIEKRWYVKEWKRGNVLFYWTAVTCYKHEGWMKRIYVMDTWLYLSSPFWQWIIKKNRNSPWTQLRHKPHVKMSSVSNPPLNYLKLIFTPAQNYFPNNFQGKIKNW